MTCSGDKPQPSCRRGELRKAALLKTPARRAAGSSACFARDLHPRHRAGLLRSFCASVLTTIAAQSHCLSSLSSPETVPCKSPVFVNSLAPEESNTTGVVVPVDVRVPLAPSKRPVPPLIS